jgi:hypothetical protein
MIFAEQGGFETHYSGVQLTFMAALHALMGYDIGSNVYQDASEQAEYMNARLSESGTMHGGTRHNEVSGSKTDIAVGLGYNLFSNRSGADLGRVKLKDGSVSRNPIHSQIYGHRASGIILLHAYFEPWDTSRPTQNQQMALQKGGVSVYLDSTNQPQEISVNGTSFTENLFNNGQRAQGFFYQTSSGSWRADAAMRNNYYAATDSYQIRTLTGTAAGAGASVKTRYITDGASLYHITLVKFEAATTLRSANVMIGLPNVSATSRVTRIYDLAGTGTVLDLSLDAGSLTTARFRAGDVDLEGWPRLRAENTTASGNRWMSAADSNRTLEDLINVRPRIFWIQKPGEESIGYADSLRVNIHTDPSGQAYAAGDVICAVAKFSPAGSPGGFAVTPTYQAGSTFKITSMVVEDEGMRFTFGWSAATFTDKASGQTLSL